MYLKQIFFYQNTMKNISAPINKNSNNKIIAFNFVVKNTSNNN